MFIKKINFNKYGMDIQLLDENEKNVVAAINEIFNIYQAMHKNKKDPCIH